MKNSLAILILALLLAGVFSLATVVQPRSFLWMRQGQSGSVLKLLLGGSRRLVANQFFIKADVYFHSGYYPSIFDQARTAEEKEMHMAHAQQGHEEEHEKLGGFFGKPTDWIDRFGRKFRINKHTHLHGERVGEILPWLRISADLDPHRVETYTVAAYWLRTSVGKVDQAEEFLREGMRANPGSYEIPYELGRLFYENRHDPVRAANLWRLALRRWQADEGKKKEPNYVPYDKITVHLAKTEEDQGHYTEAIKWLEMAKPHAPEPAALQKQIDALRDKVNLGKRPD